MRALSQATGVAALSVLVFAQVAVAVDAIVTDKGGAKTMVKSVALQRKVFTAARCIYCDLPSHTEDSNLVPINTGALIVAVPIADIQKITIASPSDNRDHDGYYLIKVLLRDATTSFTQKMPVFWDQDEQEDVLRRFGWAVAGIGELGPFAIDIEDVREVSFAPLGAAERSPASRAATQANQHAAVLVVADSSRVALSLVEQSFQLRLDGGAAYTVNLEPLEAIRFSVKKRKDAHAGYNKSGDVDLESKSGQHYKGSTDEQAFGLRGHAKFGNYDFDIIVPFSGNAEELRFSR